jgi:hypothetical protein
MAAGEGEGVGGEDIKEGVSWYVSSRLSTCAPVVKHQVAGKKEQAAAGQIQNQAQCFSRSAPKAT